MDSIKLICLGKYSWYPLLGIRGIFSLNRILSFLFLTGIQGVIYTEYKLRFKIFQIYITNRKTVKQITVKFIFIRSTTAKELNYV